MSSVFVGISLLIWSLSASWSVSCSRFRVDDLSYIYTVDQNSVTKYTRQGKLEFVYSRMDLGKTGQLDVSDPLRPLVFFPETGTLVALDNTLSEQRVLRLWEGQFGMPEWVASGVNQEFWVYDGLNKEIIRIDERMNRRSTTGYLPAVTGHDPEIVGLAERHEKLIIADRKHGLWIFDRFGTYVRSVPIEGIRELRTHAPGMTIITDDGVYWQRYGDFFPTKVDMPMEGAVRDVDQKRAYILADGKLSVFNR